MKKNTKERRNETQENPIWGIILFILFFGGMTAFFCYSQFVVTPRWEKVMEEQLIPVEEYKKNLEEEIQRENYEKEKEAEESTRYLCPDHFYEPEKEVGK